MFGALLEVDMSKKRTPLCGAKHVSKSKVQTKLTGTEHIQMAFRGRIAHLVKSEQNVRDL